MSCASFQRTLDVSPDAIAGCTMVSRHHAKRDHCVQSRYRRRSTCRKILKNSPKTILIFHCVPSEHNSCLDAPLVRILFEALDGNNRHKRSKMNGLTFESCTFDNDIFWRGFHLHAMCLLTKGHLFRSQLLFDFRSASPLFPTQKAMNISWCLKTFHSGFKHQHIKRNGRP